MSSRDISTMFEINSSVGYTKGVFYVATGSERAGNRWLSLALSQHVLKLHVAGKIAATVETFEISGRWKRETKQ